MLNCILITVPSGTESLVPEGDFDKLNLSVFADLYNTLGEHDKAVRLIKAGSRVTRASNF
jgi:hypothetical protein